MRDAVKSARTALRGLHAAERQLLHAGESTATHQALDALAGLQRVARSSGVQAISAKYAARLAAMGAALDHAARAAMRRQLQLEEAQETARFEAEQDREAQQNRQALLKNLATARKSKQRALQQRHRIQRTALAMLLRRLIPHGRHAGPTPRPAIRQLATRIPYYRSGTGAPDGVTTQ